MLIMAVAAGGVTGTVYPVAANTDIRIGKWTCAVVLVMVVTLVGWLPLCAIYAMETSIRSNCC